MKFKWLINSLITLAGIYMCSMPLTGCQKELYFEGVDTSGLPPSTIDPNILVFPLCPPCNSMLPLKEGEWSFHTNTSYLCGTLTDGIITADKNAFTFFGPSKCSIDTGMVITAYIDPARLIGDTTNVHSTGVAFYYYDHNSNDYILVSKTGTGFTLTIDKYIQSTGIATGIFSGGSFRANGNFIYISEGRFNVKLRR